MLDTVTGTVTRRTAATGILAVATLGLSGIGTGSAAAAGTAVPAAPPAGGPRRVTSAAVTPGGGGTLVVSWTGERVDAVEVFASTDPRAPERTGTLAAVSADASIVVPGLDPRRRWYFAVRPRHGGTDHALVAANRQVVLQGAVNARDLGGYENADGRRVAWGRVYRADALSRLSAADVDRLAALGLRTVVDFRGPQEVAHDGVDRVPDGVTVIQRPVTDAGADEFTAKFSQALATADNAVLEELLGGGRGAALMIQGHTSLVLDELPRRGLGETMRRIADGARTPLLYHCTAGKDRTGVMSALVLLALGVPDETIVADYVLSNHYRYAANQATYAYLSGKGVDVALLPPVMEQAPEYLRAALAALRAEYGDTDTYLLRGLGLTRAEIAAMRRALLD